MTKLTRGEHLTVANTAMLFFVGILGLTSVVGVVVFINSGELLILNTVSLCFVMFVWGFITARNKTLGEKHGKKAIKSTEDSSSC